MKKLLSFLLSASLAISAAASSTLYELPCMHMHTAHAAEAALSTTTTTVMTTTAPATTEATATTTTTSYCGEDTGTGTTVTSSSYIYHELTIKPGEMLEFLQETAAMDHKLTGDDCCTYYENGLLVAKEPGACRLIFFNEDGSIYAMYPITVIDNSALEPIEISIEEDTVCTVPVYNTPDPTTLTVVCEDPTVAEVTEVEHIEGEVQLINIHLRGAAEGTTTVTVSDDADYCQEIIVYVYESADIVTTVSGTTTTAPAPDTCEYCGAHVAEGEGVYTPLGMFLCPDCVALGIGGTTPPVFTTTTDSVTTTVFTGTATTTTATAVPEDIYVGMLMGDTNCDGSVSVSDLVLAARLIAQTSGGESGIEISADGLLCADFNKDGMLDASDINAITLYLSAAVK